MWVSSAVRLFAVGAVLSACAVACVVENDHGHGYSSAGGGGPSGSTPPPANTTPLLVDVDTGGTMTAQPGDGVGVFTEYTAGGHWHIWWTCDTNKTGQSCPMDVKVSVSTGAIANVASDSPTGAAPVLATSGQQVESVTTTTTSVDGIKFDTAPGGIITLEASVGGLEDGSFLFFVQDGKINGGYTGKLTDPLMLEGATP